MAGSLKDTFAQFIRFVIVGSIAALLYVALASVLVAQAQLATWLASAVAYTCMIIPAYFAQRQFAFRAGTNHSTAMPRYLTIQAICAGLSALLAWAFESLSTLPPVVVFVCVAAVLAVFSFVLSRFWVFAAKAL